MVKSTPKTKEKEKDLSLSRRAVANRVFRKRKAIVRSMVGLEGEPCSYQGTAASLVCHKGTKSLILGRVVSIDTFREVLRHSHEICDLLASDKLAKPAEITSDAFREIEKRTVLSELKQYLESVEEVLGKFKFQELAADALEVDSKVKWKSMPKKRLLLILRKVHEKFVVGAFDNSMYSAPLSQLVCIHGPEHFNMPPLMQVPLMHSLMDLDLM